ncbi:uncharacterized protein TNCT_504281 [Trichonephila clavata]|uniref:Uncharacterized protein n=1 Tax=Trichonephila clavata TaxID=2740835 RepID=A0A8X6LPJ3_TRICU|nr:uncharacterized protein TNCT_504281 [Trichonephila clavata]
MGAMQGGRGHGHRHHNNNRLMELLTAGIVAKVLQKQEGDGGGGHEYYPVPIHLPIHHHHGHGMGMSASESHGHHHHVTEKIIPIPIPHHTTRIIHINADAPHPLSGGGNKASNSFEHGGGSYDSSSEGQSHHHSGSSPATIKQIFFQDSGVYTSPMQVTPVRHQGYMAYRRPTMGMVPAAAAHPAYLLRSRYPSVAVRPRMPYAAASMYAMPYRRAPAPAYVNPMMMRRPYPVPMPMPAPVPAMW